MEDREYTDKEIDILIDFVKTSDIPEQNKQRKIDLFEAMRPDKKKEVQLATVQELDSVFGSLTTPRESKGETPKSNMNSELDKIYGAL